MVKLTEIVLFGFYLSHIFATIFIDSQVIFGQHYPPALQNLITFWIEFSGDHLVSEKPHWFKSLIATELIFQLPIFFLICQQFLKHSFQMDKFSRAVKIVMIIYCAHVITTMIPILYCFCTERLEMRTTAQQVGLIGIYLPYLLFPLLTLVKVVANFDEKSTTNANSNKRK